MKKIKKIVLIILLIIVVAIGATAVWQRKNIVSIMQGLTMDAGEIENKKTENDKNLINQVNSFLDQGLRMPTDEEQKMIDGGKVTYQEIYTQILEETNNEKVVYNQEKEEFEFAKKEPGKNTPELSNKDEIINKYIAQMYALEVSFESRSEALIAEGKAYFEEKKKTMSGPEARANTIAAFTSRVRAVQSDCDSKVNEVVSQLEKELIKIKADTSIISTIRSTYENKKQLKLSYYSNKYLK